MEKQSIQKIGVADLGLRHEEKRISFAIWYYEQRCYDVSSSKASRLVLS